MTQLNLQDRLREYLEDNQPFYFEMLHRLVSINSFTANQEGVNEVGNLTAELFAEIGFQAERVPSAHPLYGEHLILTRPGTTTESISLVSHLDTVFPADEERRNNFHWRVEGDRLYGPGSVDIKGGTIVMYMVLSALQEIVPEFYNSISWMILLNAAEEVLTPDFGHLCRARITADTLACLVFEQGHVADNVCSIVTARKGMATYRISVEGRAAHAGSSHKIGANAVVQLARTIARVADLTDYAREITFNIGTVAGGTVINRVPHMAVASGEMRAFSTEVYEEGLQKLLLLQEGVDVGSANGDYPCQINIEIMARWGPWARNEATQRLLKIWQASAQELGMEAISEERGGLSDGNFTWNYVPTIDGLGPSGDNAHCSERSNDGSKDQEYSLASSYIPKALLTILSIMKLGGYQSE